MAMRLGTVKGGPCWLPGSLCQAVGPGAEAARAEDPEVERGRATQRGTGSVLSTDTQSHVLTLHSQAQPTQPIPLSAFQGVRPRTLQGTSHVCSMPGALGAG